MAQGILYTAQYRGVAVTTASDLIEVQVPSTNALVLHYVKVGQDSLDADANADVLSIQIKRATISGSGGTGVTPSPLVFTDPASSCTVERNNSTAAAGTVKVLDTEAWNVMAPYHYLPTPECRPVFQTGGKIVVALAKAPDASIDVCLTVCWEEIGD